MEEEYLKITVTPMRVPKNKIIRYLFWNIYWRVWKIWKPKFLAWFYGGLANWFEKHFPDQCKED